MADRPPPPFSDPDFAREAGRKGGLSSGRSRRRRNPPGLSDLPPLVDHESAQAWLEAIGRGVLTGTVKAADAGVGVRAVETWMKAQGELATMKVVEELTTEVERLKDQLGGVPIRAIQ